jgi:probable HAF family extracellular repeat protein
MNFLPGGFAPSAINNVGQIVGAFDSAYSGNAFVYGAGGLTTLGPLLDEHYAFSTALAINNAGTVIGLAQPWIGESQRAYVYDGATMRMIPTFGGDCVDVRLDLVSAVPEPAHALLLLAGLPLVLRSRGRAQRRL